MALELWRETFTKAVADRTGLNRLVVLGWTYAENAGPNNPLGIMPDGKLKDFGSPAAAAAGTANLLLTSKNYAGIRAAARAGDAQAQIAAIAASPWDACHYRGTNPDGTCRAAGKPGDALRGAYQRAVNVVAGSAGGAVTGTAKDTVNAASDVVSTIADLPNWIARNAGVALLYVALTLASGGLVLLGLSRALGLPISPLLARREPQAAGAIPF